MFRCMPAALLAVVAVLATAPTEALSDKLVRVPTGDPEMAAAIAKARSRLPEFWKALAQPAGGESGFALKVAIRDGTEVEHFWLVDVSRNGERYSGTINNDPEVVHSVQSGQRYDFGEADISDWMFMRNGKIVGNETMRPLLKRMPEAEAERYRAMLEAP